MRSSISSRAPGLAAVWVMVSAGALMAQQRPVPVETSLRYVNIGGYDRPTLSPDGRLAAYITTEGPPESSLTSMFGSEVQQLPTGTLAAVYGARLHVTDVRTGETLEIHPGPWSNWNPSFSPDSRRLAFYSDAGGVPQLWVADVATGQSRRVSGARIFVKMWNPLDRPVWARDGSGIFVLTALEVTGSDSGGGGGLSNGSGVVVRASGEERRHLPSAVGASTIALLSSRPGMVRRTAIELIDIATGDRRVVAAPTGELQPHAISVSPSQRWIAYIAARSIYDRSSSELHVVHVADGETRSLGAPDPIVYDGPGSSDSYGAAMRWSPTSDRLVFVRDSALHVVDVAGGGDAVRLAPRLGKISAPTVDGSSRYDQPTFTSDGSTLVARLPGDTVVFAVVPLDGGPARRIALNRILGFRGLVTSRGNVLWQPYPGTFVFTGVDPDNAVPVVMQVNIATGEATPLLQEQSAITFLSSVTPQLILVHYTDAETPPDLFLFDRTLKERKRITHVVPELDGVSVGPFATFATRVPTADGSIRTLNAAVALPPDHRSGDPLPAIVYVYPGSEMSRNVNAFGAGRLAGVLAQFWTSRGYAVVYPDLTGITPITVRGGNLVREIADILLPQMYRAAELGYIDIDRLVLSGHSFGGYATVATITHTGLFRAAVAYASAPLDLLATSRTEWPPRVARIGFDVTPWTALKQYLTNSPWHQADMITTPLLLVHGLADNVPSESSEAMFRALDQLGKTAQLALYEGEPHSIARWSMVNAVDVTQRVLDFVSRYATPAMTHTRAVP